MYKLRVRLSTASYLGEVMMYHKQIGHHVIEKEELSCLRAQYQFTTSLHGDRPLNVASKTQICWLGPCWQHGFYADLLQVFLLEARFLEAFLSPQVRLCASDAIPETRTERFVPFRVSWSVTIGLTVTFTFRKSFLLKILLLKAMTSWALIILAVLVEWNRPHH